MSFVYLIMDKVWGKNQSYGHLSLLNLGTKAVFLEDDVYSLP